MNDEIAAALIKNDMGEFNAAVRKTGFTSLAQNAMQLAFQGITTISEVLRATSDESSFSEIDESESASAEAIEYANL
jgi:hypothetical protein